MGKNDLDVLIRISIVAYETELRRAERIQQGPSTGTSGSKGSALRRHCSVLPSPYCPPPLALSGVWRGGGGSGGNAHGPFMFSSQLTPDQ